MAGRAGQKKGLGKSKFVYFRAMSISGGAMEDRRAHKQAFSGGPLGNLPVFR